MEANKAKAEELREEIKKRVRDGQEIRKIIIITVGRIQKLSKHVGTEADKLSLWAITKRFNESVDSLEKLLKE